LLALAKITELVEFKWWEKKERYWEKDGLLLISLL
jgi:hypothetical protein